MFKINKIKKDTFISKQSPQSNYGQGNQLYITSGSENNREMRSLMWFDTSEILSSVESGSLGNYTFKLKSFMSDLRLMGNDFTISCHPLTKNWDEGIGNEFETNIGTSWNNYGIQNGYFWDESEFPILDDEAFTAWDTAGGDFNNAINYPTEIIEEEMALETDITNYINSINNGDFTNNGLIFIADNINYNLAINSTQCEDELSPFVVSYVDDFVIEDTTAELFELPKNNMNIKVLNYENRVMMGEELTFVLNIDERYRVAGFTYSRELKYLDNIYYKIHYDVTDQEIIPYSEFTKVPVLSSFNGLTARIDTSEFNRGLHWVQFKYDDGDVVNYTDKKYFLIE